jgi:hypothetical protein
MARRFGALSLRYDMTGMSVGDITTEHSSYCTLTKSSATDLRGHGARKFFNIPFSKDYRREAGLFFPRPPTGSNKSWHGGHGTIHNCCGCQSLALVTLHYVGSYSHPSSRSPSVLLPTTSRHPQPLEVLLELFFVELSCNLRINISRDVHTR